MAAFDPLPYEVNDIVDVDIGGNVHEGTVIAIKENFIDSPDSHCRTVKVKRTVGGICQDYVHGESDEADFTFITLAT